jgi:hypothetical protein
MAVEVGKTTVLDAADIAKDEDLLGSDFKNIMKRANSEEELVTDAACQGGGAGGGGKTESGHDHDANGNGRGIMRMVCGGFQIMNVPMILSWQYAAPSSMAASVSYANMYKAATGYSNLLNYIMGKAFISLASKRSVLRCVFTPTLLPTCQE